jgi:hypothetical protein
VLKTTSVKENYMGRIKLRTKYVQIISEEDRANPKIEIVEKPGWTQEVPNPLPVVAVADRVSNPIFLKVTNEVKNPIMINLVAD